MAKRTEQFNLRVDDEEKAEWETKAKAGEVSVAKAIRIAMARVTPRDLADASDAPYKRHAND